MADNPVQTGVTGNQCLSGFSASIIDRENETVIVNYHNCNPNCQSFFHNLCMYVAQHLKVHNISKLRENYVHILEPAGTGVYLTPCTCARGLQ